MLYLATASASDGIDPWVWVSAGVCLVASAILVLVALGFLVLAKAGVRRIAMVSAGLSLFPFFLAAYASMINSLAVRNDGTPVGGSLWNAVLIPSTPLLASVLMICWRYMVPVKR